jgi:hypothetical protein
MRQFLAAQAARDCRTIADQTTDMSINPISRSLQPYQGPSAAANRSPTAAAPPRGDTVTLGNSTSGESNSDSGRYGPAIGLYRRVSQYKDDRSSASGLMKSWNEIVRENQFEQPGVAGYVKAVAQNDAVALPSSVLHLTV